MTAISQLAAGLIEAWRSGKLPEIAKGGYYSVLSAVLIFGLSKFDAIEKSITDLSHNIARTNEVILVNAETTNWHGREIERHSRELERQWDRIIGLESAARDAGLAVPNPPKKIAPPSKPSFHE